MPAWVFLTHLSAQASLRSRSTRCPSHTRLLSTAPCLDFGPGNLFRSLISRTIREEICVILSNELAQERIWYPTVYIYSFALFHSNKTAPELLRQEHRQRIYHTNFETGFLFFRSGFVPVTRYPLGLWGQRVNAPVTLRRYLDLPPRACDFGVFFFFAMMSLSGFNLHVQ